MSFLQHQAARSLDVTVDQTWKFLLPGVEEIYRKEAMATQRYVQLYTHVHQYCTCNNVMMPPMNIDRRFLSGNELLGERLYEKLKKFLEDYLGKITTSGANRHDEFLLDFYSKNWADYILSSNVIHHIFLYLNRHWVRREQEDKNAEVYEVYSLSLVIWREILLKQLQITVTKAVVNLIRKERNGDTINTTFVTCVRDSYVNMGVSTNFRSDPLVYYKTNFESPLIEETKVYYQLESDEFLRSNPVAEYIKRALGRLAEEKHRVEYYLHESTMPRLIQTCEDVLIEKHLQTLYEEFQIFLDGGCDEDMGRMFQLVSRTKTGLIKMQNIFENHITKKGNDSLAAVVDAALTEPSVYVKEILKVYKHYKKLVLTHFRNHHGFVAALDKACQTYINKNAVTVKVKQPNKSPELLARYCDYLLKKSSNIEEEAELEDLLDEIMIVFKYIESKDVFQKFYSNMLAKRLVEHLSMSDEAEASMISKLKDSCGQLYTSKLQKMFQDIAVNQDLNVRFKQHLQTSNRLLDVDFNVEVLTHGSWPFTVKKLFALPAELETCIERFNTFYIHQQSGRKLSWLYYKSRADIVTNCFKKRYTMQASTFQVAVLLQYNFQTKYTVQQLIDNTQIEKSDLQQVLRTLVKIRLLFCNVAVPDDDTELPLTATCELFQDYNNKKQRVNINVPMRSSEKKEMEETHKTIDDDRKYLIEAAIIRIMKTKKILSHTELHGEVLQQLSSRFKPETKTIKILIDNLIQRDYLERDPNCNSTYRYLA